MTTSFDTKTANTQFNEISDLELNAVCGGDDSKDWRNDYHRCNNGTAGGGGPGLYPLYIKCK
jgi:hypothetical protein